MGCFESKSEIITPLNAYLYQLFREEKIKNRVFAFSIDKYE